MQENMKFGKERLEQQIRFITEVDKVKNIFRQTYLADGKRKENDAEHSWHLGALGHPTERAYEGRGGSDKGHGHGADPRPCRDRRRGIPMPMTRQGAVTKREREVKAADRIFGLLPEDQRIYFRTLWEEFEAYETAEAKFAHLLDNFQPLLLNDASDGKSWAEHGVHKSQVCKRNERIPETVRDRVGEDAGDHG